MAVNRNERTYPLVLKSDPINVGLASAFDWAAEDGSTTTSHGKDHSGFGRHLTAAPATPTIVQTSVGKGRDTTIGRTTTFNAYTGAGVATIGLDVGTGDYTIWHRLRTPSVAATTNQQYRILRLTDSAGDKILIYMYEVSTTGAWHWYVVIGGTVVLNWSSTGNPLLAANTITDLHITSIAGTVRCSVNGVLLTTTAKAISLLTTTGGSQLAIGNFENLSKADVVHIDSGFWTRGFSPSEVTAHQANPYSYYNYASTPDTITVAAPVASSSVSGVGFTVSGTYAGGTSVTSVEASFNGGAYVTIASGAGSFSGQMTGQAGGTGPLIVRTKNGAAVVASTTVNNVTVVTDSIAFSWVGDTKFGAQPWRMFQRDANGQSAVRITGTYTGTPTSIEYRWGTGAWTTLIASPTGGVFDQAVMLQGPGQKTLSVRFGNSTGITADMPYVGVGRVFIAAGQSNNVGSSPIFVQPVAPSAHPEWLPPKLAKDGVWKQHKEQADDPFDNRTNATYPVQGSGTPTGSYFGVLATKIMEAGWPVAFVPCALGSTGIAAWAVSASTSSLYGAMLARAQQIGAHERVIWWQGEAEADAGNNMSQAAYETNLNALIDHYHGVTGVKWFICAINTSAAGTNAAAINAAALNVAATNPRVSGSCNMAGAFTGDIHYDTSTDINEVATRVFTALQSSDGVQPHTLVGAACVQANASSGGAVAMGFSFTTAQLGNNTSTGWPPGTPLHWQWHQGGRIGQASTSVTYGTGTLNAEGRLVAPGLPAGAGYLLAAIRGANYTLDDPYYEPGTAA